MKTTVVCFQTGRVLDVFDALSVQVLESLAHLDAPSGVVLVPADQNPDEVLAGIKAALRQEVEV